MNCNIKDLIDHSNGWPGMNPHAFASLCERVDDCFTLVPGDSSIHLEYIYDKHIDGQLLKSPFQCLYNLNVNLEHATKISLLFNTTILEVVEEEEASFDIFTEKFMFPIDFMQDNDELRIQIELSRPSFAPKKLGSARLVRCNWSTKKPCLIALTQNSAIMFDGTKINCVSNIINMYNAFGNDEGSSIASSLSTDIQELVDDVVNNNAGNTNVIQSIMNHMETAKDITSLRRHVNKTNE